LSRKIIRSGKIYMRVYDRKIPAFAGMTSEGAGMTSKGSGMIGDVDVFIF